MPKHGNKGRERAFRAAEPGCDRFGKCLTAYAAAAGATCVGLLAAAQPAKADVVYTPAHIRLLDSGVVLDLDHDSIKEFRIHQSFNDFKGFGLSATALPSGQLLLGSGSRFAAALKSGSQIGGSRHPWAKFGLLAGSYGGVSTGYWTNAQNRYLGLRFLIKGEIHYGWARLNVRGAGHAALLTGYAYETVADQPIIAGQTHALTGNTRMHEPGALALLALGSLGLSFRRRKDHQFSIAQTPNV
jgi:hypothetical protein